MPPLLKPAVFLDRDGTLIEDRGHLREPSEVVFYEETVEALRRLQARFVLFIVTNQPGVAQGLLTHMDVKRLNDYVVSKLGEAGIKVVQTYVCPHQRSDRCPCIKPEPYFPLRAAECYSLDLSRSFSVGDHPHDVELATRAGLRAGIYLLSGHGVKHRHEVPANTWVAANIGEAAAIIEHITSADEQLPQPG